VLKNRYIQSSVLKDLQEKMVFLAGPRQVGKTTLARDIIGKKLSSCYFLWDKIAQRTQALQGEWPSDKKLIILDEFHKFRKWKSWIKGEYDTLKTNYRFLLTGSARLAVYRRGGDSLQGRYHYYRLHPFSLAELEGKIYSQKPGQELEFFNFNNKNFELLNKFGGFPEPLQKQNEKHLRRWHLERIEKIINEDVRDLTLIQDIGNLTLLSKLLIDRASSICSINSLAEDLHVHFNTISKWIYILEELYYCFRLSPFFSKKILSVRKEKKIYLWDWSQVEEVSLRIENLVAQHLLKFCHYLKDAEGWDVDLYYLRDQTGREVDFLVTLHDQPWLAIEVKQNDTELSRALLYFKEKLKIPYCYQLVLKDDQDFIKNDIRVITIKKFLTALL